MDESINAEAPSTPDELGEVYPGITDDLSTDIHPDEDGAVIYDFEAVRLAKEDGESAKESNPAEFDDPEALSIEEEPDEPAVEPAAAPREVRRDRKPFSLGSVLVTESALNDFMRQHGRHRLLTPSEELALARSRDAGNLTAVETICEHNIKLLVKIARGYQGRGLPLIDLVQEGSLGLLRAAEKFDPDRKLKFSTYATWWIRQAIKRGLENTGKTIRVPVHQHDRMSKATLFEEVFTKRFGRKPTDAEIEEHFNWKAGQLASVRSASAPIASLEKPLGDEDSFSLGTILPDTSVDVEGEVQELLQHEHLGEILASLPFHEQVVLRSYFGLLETPQQNLAEIAKNYSITRELVQKIRDRGLFHLAEGVRNHHYSLL
jgi:RNA polymerase primary sigma factor